MDGLRYIFDEMTGNLFAEIRISESNIENKEPIWIPYPFAWCGLKVEEQ